MAHVLLPCELPSWPKVQRHLSQLRLVAASDIPSLVEAMDRIHDICSISLDPDDPGASSMDRADSGEMSAEKPGRFDPLRRFLEEACTEEERSRFTRLTLPCLVNHAVRLRTVRPPEGFHYLLQQEERSVTLDRQFIFSLLANAFFSTFPRRLPKTHPTLQDFNFVNLFQHLQTDYQQMKLKNILRYFENAGYENVKGSVRYTRKVLLPPNIPSLPQWLCSDRPLCPLVLRSSPALGGIENSEPHVYKVLFSSPKVGGATLQDGYSQESRLFCAMPELLVSICFAESLLFNEALVVQGVLVPGNSSIGGMETDVCIMDAMDFSSQPGRQYEDQPLLRELTKCYTAFLQPKLSERLSPVGRSASPTPPPLHDSLRVDREDVASKKPSKMSLGDVLGKMTPKKPQPLSLGEAVGQQIRHNVVPPSPPPPKEDVQRAPRDERKEEIRTDCVLKPPLPKLPSHSKTHLRPPSLKLGGSGGSKSSDNCDDFYSFDKSMSSRRNSSKEEGQGSRNVSFLNHSSETPGRSSFGTLTSNLMLATKSKLSEEKIIEDPELHSNEGSLDDKESRSSSAKARQEEAPKVGPKPNSSALHASISKMAEENALEITRYQKEMEEILNDLSKFSATFNPTFLSSDKKEHCKVERTTSSSSSKKGDCHIQKEKGKSRGMSDSKSSSDKEHDVIDHLKSICSYRSTDDYLPFRKHSDPLQLSMLHRDHERFPWKMGESGQYRKYSDPLRANVSIPRKYSDPLKVGTLSSLFERSQSGEYARWESPTHLRGCKPHASVESTGSERPSEWGYFKLKSSFSQESSGSRRRAGGGSLDKRDATLQLVETLIAGYQNVERRRHNLEKRKSRSWGQISKGHFSEEDEFFTAEESISDSEISGRFLPSSSRIQRNLLISDRMLLRPTGGSWEDDSHHTNVSRGDSMGFHLDSEDDSSHLSKHERYEDFRRRIRCRTRRRSRRSSRRSSSSYLASCSSGSSDMEDISEDPDEICSVGGGSPLLPVRGANSEPNLLQPGAAEEPQPRTTVSPEALLLANRGRRLMMTTYSGQLKAYSYDGVKPNLPVPFKAKFRKRLRHSAGDSPYTPDDDKERGHFRWEELSFPAPESDHSSTGSSIDDLQEDGEEARSKSTRQSSRTESHDSSVFLPDDTDLVYPAVLMPTPEGIRPIATGKWGCGSRLGGDPQLKTVIQWLAGSLASLPSLIVYTDQDPRLSQLREVSRRAEKQGWAVGDLACETLRYCRGRIRRGPGDPTTFSHESHLFSLLLGKKGFQSHESLE